ncbi:unnamed protein product [Clonostachys byssicola]|uniref:beta-glucosidase n=1 Tax=Clonostachys byssicola TaxID=160290 RepID=A0A9N9XXL5_9HYPO|nr:unnamed protein product [Clonostachys byssicola]
MGATNVDSLVGQLTLDEKILLLAGKNFWETHEIPRLGIPSLKVTDGPSGARGATFIDGTPAACFPACVSLAATFDRELARRIGTALAQETQSKGCYVLLGPTVCIHRSPLGGRNFESFSEDPLLAGVLATEYVKGLQDERVAASVKHFFANEQDTRRFVLNETISERALRCSEIYLKPFEIVVKEARPWTLMSAYPKINGSYIDATSTWLTQVLRDEWKFDGLTMSDWGAASTVACVANGHPSIVQHANMMISQRLDLEMPGPARQTASENVYKELKEGRLTEADIDARVRASLVLLERVGKFADRGPTPAERAIDRPEHRALIREAGASAIVLLKNEHEVLPIDVKQTKRIALLGPLANHASAHGGGSSFLTCHYKIDPLQAFTERFGGQVELTYSKGRCVVAPFSSPEFVADKSLGCEIYRSLPDFTAGIVNREGKQGFDVDYFPSYDATGKSLKTEQTQRSYFTTHDQIDIKTTAMSARMSALYRPTETGSHYLSLSGAGETKLLIDDHLVIKQDGSIPDAMAFIAGCQDELKAQHYFEAGKTYRIEVLTTMPSVSISDSHILDKQLCAHVGFVPQAQMEHDLQKEAVELAKEADVTLVFVGNTYQWESEGQDMNAMVLPPYETRSQDALVSAVAAVNPKTVVMINTGVPVELPWLDEVAGLLQGWYAGQEVGNALVDVLVGDVNPSGRLPMSWPRKYEHTACYGNFGLDSHYSKEVEYVEGVFVGYRHFDRHWKEEKEVLFPFGYGLSYTDFGINHFSVSGTFSKDAQTPLVEMTVTVKNLGSRAGAQVLQVFVVPPLTEGLERPVKELAGFTKIYLAPGEERQVRMEISNNAAAFWDESIRKWRVVAGSYSILCATSSHPDHVIDQSVIVIEEEFTMNA